MIGGCPQLQDRDQRDRTEERKQPRVAEQHLRANAQIVDTGHTAAGPVTHSPYFGRMAPYPYPESLERKPTKRERNHLRSANLPSSFSATKDQGLRTMDFPT